MDGNDYVNDSGGSDTINGGTGRDVFSPGLNTNGQYGAQQNPTDQNVWTLSNTGTIGLSSYSVTLIADGSRSVSGSDGRVSTLQNFEIISFVGGAFGSNGNDSVSGGSRAEIFVGLSGNDTLTGGGGVDTLIGGAGADLFRYADVADSPVAAADFIKDFMQLEGDKIDLSAIDASTAAAGDQAFSFIGASSFSGASGEVRAQVQSDGNTHVYGAVGGGTANFEIVLAGDIVLQATDFAL